MQLPIFRGPRGAGWKAAQQLEQHAEKRDPFPGSWSQWTAAEVRGALLAMHGRVCAYCERPLPANDRGDVEHFRPKSHYWWLAFELTNYFLACRVCNSTYKRSQFPLADGQAGVGYDERAGIAGEPRLVLDPATDPVEEWLRVELEAPDSLGEVKPSATAGEVGSRRVSYSIPFFNLNWGANLREDRLHRRKEAVDLLTKVVADPADDQSRTALQRLASRYAAHGSVARQVLEAFEPALLPSPAQELGWLVDDLVRELVNVRVSEANAKLAVEQAAPEVVGVVRARLKDVTRHRDELGWALAVLLKDPPAGSPADVAGRLDAVPGVRPVVERFYQRL